MSPATKPARGQPKPPITYTVRPGDTLAGIAQWFSMHGYQELYAANEDVIGSNPNLIIPGQQITIRHGDMTIRPAG